MATMTLQRRGGSGCTRAEAWVVIGWRLAIGILVGSYGDAIARRFAMEGAKVVVSARTINDGEHYLPGTVNETVDAIRAAGGQAVGVKADLAITDDRVNLIRVAETAFGSVDILVNNAAITYFIPVSEFPEKRFRLMMDVQVWAPLELAQMVIPGMRERGSGWILNISSHAALHPDKKAGGHRSSVYGMCKAALERFTTGLAQEVYSEGVGVNVISPGFISTDMTNKISLDSRDLIKRKIPLERFGTPEEVAEVVAFLSSDEANYITGENIHVNGGMYMS